MIIVNTYDMPKGLAWQDTIDYVIRISVKSVATLMQRGAARQSRVA